MARRSFLLPLLAAALPPGAGAQPLPREVLPAHGARVRLVTTAGDRLTGVLGLIVADTLMLTVRDRAGPPLSARPVAVDHVRELWVSRGRGRGRGALYGFGLGLVGGAAVGATLGVLSATERQGCDFCTKEAGAAFGAIGGAILAAPLGAVVGALHGRERWERRWPISPPDGGRSSGAG